jgi:hypothetical protein
MLCYLDVFDQKTGDLIGNANDISHQGLNLITKEELPLLNDLSIWVEDPRTMEGFHWSSKVSGIKWIMTLFITVQGAEFIHLEHWTIKH